MTPAARSLPDTDWFLSDLYDFLAEYNVTTIAANFSRYLIDLNRSTNGENLYPGQPTPRLCPLECFSGEPVYLPGEQPEPAEIDQRVQAYWKPYHIQLQKELIRIRQEHGFALLLDAHSIRSEVPRLFAGRLPDISLGTARGVSCDKSLQQSLEATLNSQSICSHTSNGRFVGGHITRRHGAPTSGVHAVQIELSQARYLDEATNAWQDDKANETRLVLRSLIETMLDWAGKLT